jgi:hypothetical protein
MTKRFWIKKRGIVGSIYPENLTFNRSFYRTSRLNEAVRQIYMIEKELQENKNGTSEKKSTCPYGGEGGISSADPEEGAKTRN